MTTGFVVLGVGAYTIRRGLFLDEDRVMMTSALALLAVLVPLQMFIGDQHGLNTRRHQRAKLAGIEALWNTGSEVPLTLFALPDQSRERNDYAIKVPYLGSLIQSWPAMFGQDSALDKWSLYRLPLWFALLGWHAGRA